jgi:hypothetical protein
MRENIEKNRNSNCLHFWPWQASNHAWSHLLQLSARIRYWFCWFLFWSMLFSPILNYILARPTDLSWQTIIIFGEDKRSSFLERGQGKRGMAEKSCPDWTIVRKYSLEVYSCYEKRVPKNSKARMRRQSFPEWFFPISDSRIKGHSADFETANEASPQPD